MDKSVSPAVTMTLSTTTPIGFGPSGSCSTFLTIRAMEIRLMVCITRGHGGVCGNPPNHRSRALRTWRHRPMVLSAETDETRDRRSVR
jgi:hypothetical protein